MEPKNLVFNYIIIGLLVVIVILSAMPRKQRTTETGISYGLFSENEKTDSEKAA